uniref:Uncharacterized protein n=1 Tax=Strix occidentalis caurina TaxID=311401 RepID=A0A8D0FSE0_STROC
LKPSWSSSMPVFCEGGLLSKGVGAAPGEPHTGAAEQRTPRVGCKSHSASGITESSRLEKPLKLLQPHHEPPPDRSQLHQIPQRWLNPTLQPLQGWGLPPCPGQPIPTPNNPFCKEILPKSQSDPALAQLEAIPSWPAAGKYFKITARAPHQKYLQPDSTLARRFVI